MLTRRSFLALCAAAGSTSLPLTPQALAAEPATGRRYHLCLTPKAMEENPALLDIVRQAGVTDIWLAAYFYGYWYETPERLCATAARLESLGLRWHLVNVPLGHPGDSLGDNSGATALTPPAHWQMAQRPDGTKYSGTSLHPPATEENVAALGLLAGLKPDCIFLDDDFRLATGPGVIGGCFCDTHRNDFLMRHGYADARWEELLGDVRDRRLSEVLRAWVNYTCDQLTGSFRAQQAAAPEVALGNMIMYLGAEKAGIRLSDYTEVPFRVGEMMFHDQGFGPVKGKTDELFSALFHRRYARQDLAFSETTAYPADQLSARNMAAKLVVSTITGVPNTMFMSGLTPFPAAHWDVLAPAMKENARIHDVIGNSRPQGPLKHYWGEAARYVGDDQPFSLFLAMGIPFEVTDQIPTDGWTFLADFDARNLSQKERQTAGQLVCRTSAGRVPEGLRAVDESLEGLWALKRDILKSGLDVPYVVDEKPVVCAWYPEVGNLLLWNLGEGKETFQVRWRGDSVPVEVEGLAVGMVGLS
jgi:hypothetical protein